VGFDYSIIAGDIKDAGVCLIGMQMIDQNTERNNNQDTMKLLSKQTGLSYYAYSPCIDLKGGTYGTGILSKYPIESYETIPLYSGSGEQRMLGRGVVTMGGKKVHVFNTHLAHDNEAVRNEQISEIAAFLVGKEPYLFTGAFNTVKLSDFERFSGGVPASYTSGGTANSNNIVYTSPFSLKSYGEMNVFPHASHQLFWAEFTME
jgi:endonuclease/exonuclease/phosphatase family metal-dependent hydrolase